MKTASPILMCLLAAGAAAAQPALTIYNQNFAVVRDTVPLNLKAGTNAVRYAEATAHVEPDSVILRDPAGGRSMQILEQNYRNDPVSQELLLSLFEGKTIDFEVVHSVNNKEVHDTVRGKIIRSGYVPHYAAMNRYGQQYFQAQMAQAAGSAQPIVEVSGKLQFGLPGMPLFPGLGDDTVLNPTLTWLIEAERPGKFDAEVSYLTGGFMWSADYNLVAPEKGDALELTGWVTMDNQSGKTFRDAKIKLMAGDVNRIQPAFVAGGYYGGPSSGYGGGGGPPVSEKSFDEYHLYTLAHRTTLLDRETKQVEFVRAADVKAPTLYVYDGANPRCRFEGELLAERSYRWQGNKKVRVMREFVNAETNHLGMPLPKGKLRFYRRNDDGQMEFTGEDTIDHTPRNETVRVTTGDAFDLVGERTQTDFRIFAVNPPPSVDPATGLPLPDSATPAATNVVAAGPWIDESFEINLRNHKKEPVEIRVVEHLFRWSNWQITKQSDPSRKTDAQTVEFRVPLKPDEERTVSYTVHYSW